MTKKGLKSDFGQNISHLLLEETVRGKEGRKRASKLSFNDSTEFRRSEFVETRVKVHLLDEGYAYVPKMRDFTEDPREEIWRNQNFWVKEVFLRPPTFLLLFKR